MIEINITSLIKGEKRVWVKPTSKRKGHYRKVKGAKAVGDKILPKKIPILKDMNIKDRMEQTFGKEVITEYNDKLSKLNGDELYEEFKNIIEDKTFKLKFFGDWSRRMDESDGWATELLGLGKENSKWDFEFEGGAPDPLGDKESWMKSILINQEYLKREHPSGYIELYRGMGSESYDEAVEKGMKSGDDFQMRSYNLSSWSEYSEAGDAYASLRERGIVAKIKVPIGNILWSTRIVGEILHEGVHWSPRINDGQEHVIIGGGYIPVKIHSLKIYDKKMTANEYDRIRIAIHKREGLI